METTNIEDILDVAATLFAEHGYEGTGIREIARQCGSKPPSIYYHFKSKQDLYHQASARKYENAYEHIVHAIGKQKSPESKVEALVNTLFDMFLSDRVMFLLMQRDIIDHAVDRPQSVMKKHYEYHIDLIEKVVGSALGQQVNQRAALTIASLILGFCELCSISDNIRGTKDVEWLESQKAYLCSFIKQSFLLVKPT